jgi:L-2,4-diaminobutyrate decarboxylase
VLHHDQPLASAAAGWNTSDYAHHLTRRARGLPFWFSLATYGTDAYTSAIEKTLETTRAGARLVDAAEHLELLLEPELSIVLFRRRGWTVADYQSWSDEQLRRGEAFVTPSSWHNETVLRWCIVNPETTVDDLAAIIDTLA